MRWKQGHDDDTRLRQARQHSVARARRRHPDRCSALCSLIAQRARRSRPRTAADARRQRRHITGTALLAYAGGWALLASLTSRFTCQPQRWARAPAAVLATTGHALVALAPGDAGWSAAQDKFATLSTNTVHSIAGTTHAGMLVDSPGAANPTTSIDRVVRAVRTGRSVARSSCVGLLGVHARRLRCASIGVKDTGCAFGASSVLVMVTGSRGIAQHWQVGRGGTTLRRRIMG